MSGGGTSGGAGYYGGYANPSDDESDASYGELNEWSTRTGP